MKNKLERKVDSIAMDIERIFEDVKKESISKNTIEALNRFYENTLELNLEKHAVQSEDGVIGISECGVGFRLHGSDDDYHFCVEHQSITKHSSEIVSIY
jgi:hypothetical protein